MEASLNGAHLADEQPSPAATTPADPRPAWVWPTRFGVADDVNREADDPAAHGSRRRCVSLTAKGPRCQVNAMDGHLTCPAHGGVLDSSAGGHAKARSLALVREEARERAIEARLGARAVVANRVIERATDVRKALDMVIDGAKDGNNRDARMLLGYLAFAFPDVGRDDNAQVSAEVDELTTLSTDQLRALAHPS